MAVPVLHERADEIVRVAQAVGVVPRRLEEGNHRLDLVGGLVGEDQDRRLDVAEVLVEGGRRRPHAAGDVDHPQAQRTLRFEQFGGGFEEPAAGAVRAGPDDPAIGGERGLRHDQDATGYCPFLTLRQVP